MNDQSQLAKDQPVTRETIHPTPFRPPGPLSGMPSIRIPWVATILVILALLSSFAAWYVTSANSVEIVASPADAIVEVRELIAPRIGDSWILRPGKRHIHASASGYKQFDEEILVTDEAFQTHEIQLEPLPGHLRIDISPVPTAQVNFNENEVADAPTTLKDIPAGTYNIRITAPRYKLFESTVEIEGKDIEQTLSVELQPAWADVSFDSSPQNAAVFVDDEQIGVTPLSAEIIEGKRALEIRLQGYKTSRQSFNVIAGEPLNLPRILLAKADGLLAVTSNPAGATITVDGEYKGKTPQNIAVTADKTLTVRAIKPGYKPASTKATAASGETEAITLQLEPELAQVRFIVTPEDAKVFIDGKLQEKTNQVLQLPTHEHKILIQKEGHKSYETSITPRKGVEKRIRVRLRPGSGTTAIDTNASSNEQQNVSAVKSGNSNDGKTVKTYLGQDLKLFNGGKVTMGSSRREPSRRANETLHSATLARPFYLATKEVTNSQFRQFLANHVSKTDNGQDINGDKQPVANVSWNTAAMFCNWLSRKDSLPVFYQIKRGRVLGINPNALGYRLPTEAEWAWAARINSAGDAFKYPWAGSFPPQGRPGNFADQSAAQVFAKVIPKYNDGFIAAAPVGSFPPNLRGLYDMGGNVAEWIHDFYVAAPSGNATDPLGPGTGQQHVIRGSSWAHGTNTELRLSYRDHGLDARDDLGFRIARYAR